MTSFPHNLVLNSQPRFGLTQSEFLNLYTFLYISEFSLTDIHHDIKTFRTEIDKKSNSLLSKSQLIIDEIKSRPVPVNHAQPVQTNDKTKQTSQKTKQDNYKESRENSKQQQTTTATPIVIDADCDIEPQNTSS